MANTVKIGMTFRSAYADSNPLWKVTKKLGTDTWQAVVIESPDWKDTTKAFFGKEILSASNMDSVFTRLANSHEKFWKSRFVGEIVHYRDMEGSYVRYEVVKTAKKADDVKLKAIALVGNWRKFDLPKRALDGSINERGYSKAVRTGEIKDKPPNASNIWEHNPHHTEGNPHKLEPIDLSVPEMTDKELAVAKKYQLKKLVLEILQTDDIDNALNGAKELLNGALS